MMDPSLLVILLFLEPYQRKKFFKVSRSPAYHSVEYLPYVISNCVSGATAHPEYISECVCKRLSGSLLPSLLM